MRYRILAHLLTFIAGAIFMYVFLWVQTGLTIIQAFQKLGL